MLRELSCCRGKCLNAGLEANRPEIFFPEIRIATLRRIVMFLYTGKSTVNFFQWFN